LLLNLASLETLRGRPRAALAHTTRSLELLRELKGPGHPEVGSALSEIANLRLWIDDFEGAERAIREAIGIFERFPAEHPGRIIAEYQLGDVLFYGGELEEAATLFQRTIDALHSRGGIVLVNALTSLAQVRVLQNRINDAEGLAAEALRVHRRSGRVDFSKDGYLQTMLGIVLFHGGEFERAEHLLRDTVELLALHLPADHQYIASAEHYLGEVLLARRKFGDAETVLNRAIERWGRSDAPAWRSARSQSALGVVLHELGRHPEAEQHLRHSFGVLMTDLGADGEAKHLARQRVTQFYKNIGDMATLETLLAEASPPDAERAVQAAAAIH
jgi:tetratricopeptide (TPR) repeat protein